MTLIHIFLPVIYLTAAVMLPVTPETETQPVQHTVTQGDILPVIVPITGNPTDLRCDNEPMPYHRQKRSISFLVAAQYDTTGEITCTLDGKEVAQITVTERLFERIALSIPERYTATPPEILERIREERRILNATYAQSEGALNPRGFTSLPYTRVTSPYGEQRTYQTGQVSPHNGTDFGLPRGERIIAIGDGTVALARDLYFCGNTVIIDHGLDVFSVYCHLDTITAAEGQQTEAGDTIGTAGDSGLSVGVHLHLAVKVNNRWVDPLTFLGTIGALKSDILDV